MLVEKTGPRYDYRSWPGPGGEIDVPDDEGAALCSQGDAQPVARLDEDVELRQEPAQVQTQVGEAQAAESPVQAPGPAAPVKPAVNAPKAAWVDYAAGHGYSRDDANAMNKADLITALGD
jgi:hypothetical protein